MRQPIQFPFASPNNRRDLNIKFIGRLLLICMFLQQVGLYVFSHTEQDKPHEPEVASIAITSVCILGLTITTTVDYIFHKRKKSLTLNFTILSDILLCLFFTLEWISTLLLTILPPPKPNRMLQDGPPPRPPQPEGPNIFQFAAFSWKVLIPIILFYHHQFCLIAPIGAYLVLMGVSIAHHPDRLLHVILQLGPQLVAVIVGIYLEQKKVAQLEDLASTQAIQNRLSNFVLENAVHRVMVLGPSGNLKYVSNDMNMLLYEYGCVDNVNKFLKEVRDLQRHDETLSVMTSPMRCRSIIEGSSLLSFNTRKQNSYRTYTEKIVSLHELLKDFKDIISLEEIEEKKVLVFNGKIHMKGIEKPFEIRLSYMRISSNLLFIVMLKDMGHLDAITTLQNSAKYKDHLLASVSHELRTPLNGNINLVEAAIRTQGVPETVRDTLLVPALRSSKFLLHLVNDILDMAQIQAQKLRLIFQPGNLRETFLNSLQLVELQAKKKGVTLKTEFDPTLPKTFCTDHVRLTQIILNLINNSIKFTEEGFVKVSAALVTWPSLIRISIEDSGIGMKKDDVEKLFSDYTHIEHEKKAHMNPAGIGLGLNIAHNLAQLLGPKGNMGITVSSVPGQGSVFSFLIQNKGAGLRLQRQQDEDVMDDPPSVPDEVEIDVERSVECRTNTVLSSRFVKKLSELNVPSPKMRCECAKILIVDDDPFNILAFETVLMALDARFDCAYSGKSAVEKLLNRVRYSCSENCRPYKIVFMDQEMPGMTGSEAAIEIRSLQNQNLLSPIKIIGCSGHNSVEELEKFAKAGVIKCIQKPISKFVVKEILERYGV